MRRNILTLLTLTTFFTVSIITVSVISESGTTSVYAFSNGSPGGRTNSPGDASNCTACHSGTINSGSGTRIITSTIPASGYVPGDTYTITGSITEAGISRFGFEMSAERDANNTKIGSITITDATNTKTVAGSAVTHQAAGISGTGSRSWSFDWTAPAAGNGNVTFYGAFNAANSNGSTSGDNIYTATLSVTEDLTAVGLADNTSAVSTKIYPNPVFTYFQITTAKFIDRVSIYNLEGKEMTNSVRNLNTVNVESFPSGIYFVKIESDGKTVTQRVIKK